VFHGCGEKVQGHVTGVIWSQDVFLSGNRRSREVENVLQLKIIIIKFDTIVALTKFN
jgi:hypothetical protein